MKRKWTMIFVFTAVVIMTFGCVQRSGLNEQMTELLQGSGISGVLRIQSSGLESDLFLEDLMLSERGESRTISVQVRNRLSRELRFEYSFRWMRSDGTPVTTDGNMWLPQVISAKDDAWLESTVPVADAKSFKLVIRKGGKQ